MRTNKFCQSENKHLAYYTALNISPVKYSISRLSEFIHQRKLLYEFLGCPRAMVRNRHVLEIAAGSGQNSICTSLQAPASLTLVEPNPIAYKDILKVYSSVGAEHISPEVYNVTFEDFYERCKQSSKRFHLVICENWLGNSPYDRLVRRDQSSLVDDDGVYITTFMSPFGVLPNILRRLITFFTTRNLSNFDEKISKALYSLETHLVTVKSMNRSHKDWIIDNMFHPGYFNVIVTLNDLLEDLADQFEIYNSYPQYAQEVRFFKSATINDSKNSSYVDSYYRFCHCFLNYNETLSQGLPAVNKKVEVLVSELICSAQELELSGRTEYEECRTKVRSLLLEIRFVIEAALSSETYIALSEGIELCLRDDIDPSDVRELPLFSSLFGRETFYVSMIRR